MRARATIFRSLGVVDQTRSSTLGVLFVSWFDFDWMLEELPLEVLHKIVYDMGVLGPMDVLSTALASRTLHYALLSDSFASSVLFPATGGIGVCLSTFHLDAAAFLLRKEKRKEEREGREGGVDVGDWQALMWALRKGVVEENVEFLWAVLECVDQTERWKGNVLIQMVVASGYPDVGWAQGEEDGDSISSIESSDFSGLGDGSDDDSDDDGDDDDGKKRKSKRVEGEEADREKVGELLRQMLEDPRAETMIDPNTRVRNTCALGEAIIYRQLSVIPILLSHPSIDVNAPTADGSSPLHNAILYRLEDVVASLLAHPNIDPNIQDDHGNTPLHSAAYQNLESIARLILAHPQTNPRTRNRYNRSPATCAKISHHPSLYRLIRSHPAYPQPQHPRPSESHQ